MSLPKLSHVMLCSLLSLFICSSVQAADFKVGIMDIQKVLVGSDSGIAAKKRFEEKKVELEATFQKEQESLKALQQDIEKKGTVWSKEKKDEKVLEFNKMRRDLQTKSEDFRMEMKRMQDKELEPIIKALEKVVDDFGEKNGYALILDSKSGVIFYDKAYDISDSIIEELNKAMK